MVTLREQRAPSYEGNRATWWFVKRLGTNRGPPAAQARMDGDPSVRLAILIPDRETPHRASPDLLWG
jgi:hypothetical protein